MDARQLAHAQLELKDEDWQRIQTAVTKLFHLKKYPGLAQDLPLLNEKVSKFFKSEIGQFIGEFYQDKILTKCMIILRQELVDYKEAALIQKLAEIWTQFYTSILPTLLAIFASVQLTKLSVRALTLISFRDVVLLKTDIQDAIKCHFMCPSKPLPPQIQQMLLVLQSVHRTPPVEQFFELQLLVGKVVHNYLPMVVRTRGQQQGNRAPSEPPQEEPWRSSRADTVGDLADSVSGSSSERRSSSVRRRHSLGQIDQEGQNAVADNQLA